VLVATGTYLFADDAVALVFGGDAFGPTAGTLQMFAPYLALVFVDITFGTALMAANAQKAWLGIKLGALLLAAGLNAVLIPRFHAAYGNGGLGSAAATGVAELLMLVAALRLIPLPKPALALALGKDFGRAGAAAGAMAVAVWLLRDAAPAAGIALGVLTYVLGSLAFGGIRRQDIEFVRAACRLR
jgi:O-antigen/teichoic acid export membrane protein